MRLVLVSTFLIMRNRTRGRCRYHAGSFSFAELCQRFVVRFLKTIGIASGVVAQTITKPRSKSTALPAQAEPGQESELQYQSSALERAWLANPDWAETPCRNRNATRLLKQWSARTTGTYWGTTSNALGPLCCGTTTRNTNNRVSGRETETKTDQQPLAGPPTSCVISGCRKDDVGTSFGHDKEFYSYHVRRQKTTSCAQISTSEKAPSLLQWTNSTTSSSTPLEPLAFLLRHALWPCVTTNLLEYYSERLRLSEAERRILLEAWPRDVFAAFHLVGSGNEDSTSDAEADPGPRRVSAALPTTDATNVLDFDDRTTLSAMLRHAVQYLAGSAASGTSRDRSLSRSTSQPDLTRLPTARRHDNPSRHLLSELLNAFLLEEVLLLPSGVGGPADQDAIAAEKDDPQIKSLEAGAQKLFSSLAKGIDLEEADIKQSLSLGLLLARAVYAAATDRSYLVLGRQEDVAYFYFASLFSAPEVSSTLVRPLAIHPADHNHGNEDTSMSDFAGGLSSAPSPKVVLIDIGGGYYDTGDTGSSTKWLVEMYRRNKVSFDEIIVYEKQKLDPQRYQRQVEAHSLAYLEHQAGCCCGDRQFLSLNDTTAHQTVENHAESGDSSCCCSARENEFQVRKIHAAIDQRTQFAFSLERTRRRQVLTNSDEEESHASDRNRDENNAVVLTVRHAVTSASELLEDVKDLCQGSAKTTSGTGFNDRRPPDEVVETDEASATADLHGQRTTILGQNRKTGLRQVRLPVCVIKLDVDNPVLEHEFLDGLLDALEAKSNTRLNASTRLPLPLRLFEFFWEPHTHTLFNLNMQLPGGRGRGRGVAQVDHSTSLQTRRGERTSSSATLNRVGNFRIPYDYLLRLRKAGVRAHGWI
ncbi:unnamed protein product [Amoebophrya sp. A120]|nr:unnamed protein product [Amoebophrya sp. A120]|eukprot:GSA120T00000424001.1